MARKTMATIPAGHMFTVTTGVYSDYNVQGVFRALRDIEPDKLCAEWFDKHPEQNGDDPFREMEFLAQAFRDGFFEPIAAFEWHLCDYSDINEMTVSAPTELEI